MRNGRDLSGEQRMNESNGEKKGQESFLGDFLLAVALLLISIGTIILSWRMPRPSGWTTSPGVFPLFIGIVLLGMGIGLLSGAIRSGRQLSPGIRQKMTQEQKIFLKRILLATGGILFYIFVLIPTVHFTIGTMLYLIGTLWYFWRGKIYKILLISIFSALFLSAAFQYLFQVILP
jgi:hypothetical protein